MSSDTILIVDDDQDIRESVSLALELEGYDVVTANDGLEALGMLRRPSGPSPCLILLDLMMPRMSGIEFREQQMVDPRLAAIPVVILSGDGRLLEKTSHLGLEVLGKPIDLDVLTSLTERYCRRSARGPEAS